MSTAVHMTGIIANAYCPFTAYSTYLISKQSNCPAIVAYSVIVI